MDDNHEILPSPQKRSPEAAVRQNEVASQESHAFKSEQAASKVMENPTLGSQQQSTQSASQGGVQPQKAAQSASQTASSQATQAAVDDFMADAPQIADDIDLIEKEWVNKTKDIVQRTKDDPYNQNRQIVRLRADYMKKRYNKDIKLTKD